MDKWLEIISERLRDAQLPLPPGDWEVFEAKLKAKKRHSMFVRWAAAAASLAAAAAVAAFFLPKKSVEEVIEKVVSPVSPVSPIPERLAQASDTPVPPPPVILSPHSSVILSPSGEESPQGEESAPASVILSPSGEESVPQTANNAISDNDFQDYETSRETHSRRRLSVAPHLGGMRSDATADINGFGYLPFSSGNYYGSYPSSVISTTNHSIPLSFGVDISYPLTQRLAITSGIEAEVFKSEFSSRVNQATLSQKAFYLGIPLRLDWRFWQAGRFSSWIGAGGKVDRCIYARLDKEDIRDNAFNWSLVANAGLRYGLTDNVGLYVAPQITWFLKPEDPAILTYRTQNPLMFTVNAGLRFDL